ncbi:MAG TPA: hypothetical protein VJ783_18400 [Pirellulales bacterium]|nr:hypothetical protein [Pirellulales bacterium]
MLAPQTTRRRIRPGVVLLGGVVVLILLFVAALAIGWLAAKQRVRAELARIRAAGEPVSPEDLEAFYQKPPSDRDTTQLWLDAIAALDTPEFHRDVQDVPSLTEMGEELPSVGEPWRWQPAFESLLATYHEPLEKMHRAARLGGAARYPTNFSASYPASLPHLKQLPTCVRLLLLECELRARQDQPSAVADAIETMFAAGQSIEDEPMLVSQLVRLRLDVMARFQLERQLSNARFSDNDLARLDRRLAAIDYPASFHRAMLGDRASMGYFVDPSALGPLAPNAPSALFRPVDQLVYLKSMQKVVAAFQTSGTDLSDAVAEIEDEVAQLADEPLASLRYPISMASFSWIQGGATAVNQAIAGRDSARAAVAIERLAAAWRTTDYVGRFGSRVFARSAARSVRR